MSETAPDPKETPTTEPKGEPAPPAPPPPPADDWQDKVPEQYRRDTAEETILAIEQARANLEGKLRQPKDQRLALGDPGVPEGIEDVVSRTGFDLQEVLEAASQEGGLTDEMYEAFRAKAGVGKGIVNDMLAARKYTETEAKRNSEANYEAAIKVLGDKGKVDNLLSWARANLTAEERAMYEDMIQDEHGHYRPTARGAIATIRALKETAMGGSSITTGDAGGNGGNSDDIQLSDPRDIRDAMFDSKYGKDAAYTEKVDAALAKHYGYTESS